MLKVMIFVLKNIKMEVKKIFIGLNWFLFKVLNFVVVMV